MNESKAIRGRPRAFDTDKALDAALDLFWRKGYEGTSIADLTEAMGINPPSLYAAFGGKEALFRQALDRYEAKHACVWNEALSAPTAFGAIKKLLEGTADSLGDKHNPKGCLIVQAALNGGDECDPVRRELAERRNKSVAMIRARLQRAKREGDLPKGADPASLARYVATVIHGMAVQAVSGVSRSELRRVAATALQAWPN
ncbi:MAG TPA: TetR/AcrR family transcriptional regulator [Methyloceanibacter sp.]|jgi:AcrR family transcriptional regulator